MSNPFVLLDNAALAAVAKRVYAAHYKGARTFLKESYRTARAIQPIQANDEAPKREPLPMARPATLQLARTTAARSFLETKIAKLLDERDTYVRLLAAGPEHSDYFSRKVAEIDAKLLSLREKLKEV